MVNHQHKPNPTQPLPFCIELSSTTHFYDSTHFNAIENCTCIQLEIKAMFWTLEVTFCIHELHFALPRVDVLICTLGITPSSSTGCLLWLSCGWMAPKLNQHPPAPTTKDE
jgi:hypothetical protein